MGWFFNYCLIIFLGCNFLLERCSLSQYKRIFKDQISWCLFRRSSKTVTFTLLTARITGDENLLNSISSLVRCKDVSISVETETSWTIQLMRCWTSLSRTTHHASKSKWSRSNNTIVHLINDEEMSISIKGEKADSGSVVENVRLITYRDDLVNIEEQYL